MSSVPRHKCFLSYHKDDLKAVEKFAEKYSQIFIAKVLGALDQKLVDSKNLNYIMRQIREEYLQDSTVTIVLLGQCTWSRKFVDWEIASSLRNDLRNKRSGLLGIVLPSVGAISNVKLSERMSANMRRRGDRDKYARLHRFPDNDESLRGWIEDAFEARQTRQDLIDNRANLKQRNSPCRKP